MGSGPGGSRRQVETYPHRPPTCTLASSMDAPAYCSAHHTYIRGATRRIPATNEYTPNPGDRNRTRDRETRIFRGPEPGPPGTRVPGQHIVPFTVIKRTQYVDDRAYFDCIWRRELQAPSATSLCILTQDPPSALDEHCYWKFFIVGESTLNKLCHVVARYPGGRRMHVCNVLQFKRCDCWT